MLRTLWAMVVACLWTRQRTALSRSTKSYKAWDKFVLKSVGLKPNKLEPIDVQIRHALAQDKADQLAEVAGKDKVRFARRYKTYARARDFLPRWVWAYVPYAEISALGVVVGWLAHNKPETLAYAVNQAVYIAGLTWSHIAGAGQFVASLNSDDWYTGAVCGTLTACFGGTCWLVRHVSKKPLIA